VIVCVCPPHAAAEVADQVVACGFKGIYADANAVSPQTARRIGRSMREAGARFVDGGIIGGPAWKPGTTWLYLSGQDAEEVAACFAAGPFETEIISDEIGKASALKMCYSANSKGKTALMCAMVAAADEMGVRDALVKQWSRHGSDMAESAFATVSRATAKAWRFAGEMDEIAATFEAAGLPGGFHRAAGDVYRRIARFKGADPTPALEDVLEALLNPGAGQDL
jgi:3-hydroxyisobutyrate dehydrogenase-like beta-hydroxyacid dehydrogenase